LTAYIPDVFFLHGISQFLVVVLHVFTSVRNVHHLPIYNKPVDSCLIQFVYYTDHMYAHDPALVELEYFENFGVFAFFTILFFRHSFGGRDSLKKSRILEEFAHHDVGIQFGHMMQGGIVYIYMHIYTNIYRYGLASVNTNVFTSTCQQTCMHSNMSTSMDHIHAHESACS